jgi:predicted RNA-binding protein associated with RNAse of E/G family
MARQTSTAIIERKTRLDGSVSDYRCERLSLEVGRRAVLRYVMDREWAIGDTGVVLHPGQITIAHYWTDRPYNVYHWLDGDRTIAYYCNIASETIIREDVVGYTDLVVDVLLRSSGETLVLDEEELPPDLAPALRIHIARALETIAAGPRRLAAEIERETRTALIPRPHPADAGIPRPGGAGPV